MIKRIDYINNFGVFDNFVWEEDKELKDFNERNIIYGWNYSGKTTFSKIFSSLRDRQLNKYFSDGEFKLSLNNDNLSITQNELEQLDFDVQVFNSEYVRDKLKWESDVALDGIEFDVGENIETRRKITKNIRMIERLERKLDCLHPAIDEFNKFDQKLFTIESRRIKNEALNSSIEFTKREFKSYLNEITDKLLTALLNYHKNAIYDTM